MDRSKFIAIVTGALSLIIATAYLMLVQLLDFRGEMIPAPVSLSSPPTQIAYSIELDSQNFDIFSTQQRVYRFLSD